MLRQSIELLLKAGLGIKGLSKRELQCVFLDSKHNVVRIYENFKTIFGVDNLNSNEIEWLESYLDSIEVVDSNSDLFRYPFKDDFMSQYGNKSLDILHMGNRLIYCYSTINKMIFGECFDDDSFDLSERADFIQLANSGIGNCYLWDSPWGDGFHKQITGYSEVAKYLFEKFSVSKDEGLFYPIIFLMRNAIEIALKRLLHMRTDVRVNDSELRRKRNSHLLYKDLWKTIKPVIHNYAVESGYDLETIDIAESYILSLKEFDRRGDKFRYPCTYA